MTATISRLYNSYADAKEALRNLEAAGVPHNDISIIASNADKWYSSDRTGEQGTFPDRDLDGTAQPKRSSADEAGLDGLLAARPRQHCVDDEARTLLRRRPRPVLQR